LTQYSHNSHFSYANLRIEQNRIFAPYFRLAVMEKIDRYYRGVSYLAIAIFVVAQPLFGAATVATDQSDYTPGQTVVITGAGFQPGESVTLRIDENPDVDADSPIIWAVATDAGGSFTDTSFVINAGDVGVTFTLTAVGQTSGLTAATVFTDNKNLKITFAGSGTGSVAVSDTTDSSKNTTCTNSKTPAL
jgi:hypothetical protein